MHPELKTKLQDRSHDDVLRWAPGLLAFASGVLGTVFGAYVINFALGSNWSKDPAVWGQFGDFIGGTTNPILAFLTFIGLLLTIILQGKQLENSNRQIALSTNELELTRKELARAAQAQERAEKELGRQAKAAIQSAHLSSINLLLEQYRAELTYLKTQAFVASDPRLARSQPSRGEGASTRFND